MLPEKLWRCDCGAEVFGVSFYTWRDDPPDWFIEVYALPGVHTFRWRLRQMANLLLGRDVVLDCAALDRHKVGELVDWLSACIEEAGGTTGDGVQPSLPESGSRP